MEIDDKIKLIKKTCIVCGETKEIDNFSFRKDTNKYRNICKKCNSIKCKKYKIEKKEYLKNKNKDYYIKNKKILNEKSRERSKKWYIINKEKKLKKCREYVKNNKEKRKNYYLKNRKKIIENKKNYYNDNFDKQLHRVFGNRIRFSLKKNKNGHKWEELTGYSLDDLKKHLESQFDEKMNWNNYGREGWHIDHIIPIDYFNIKSYNDKEFKICWSLENLRPLWKFDNLSKKNKLPKINLLSENLKNMFFELEKERKIGNR